MIFFTEYEIYDFIGFFFRDEMLGFIQYEVLAQTLRVFEKANVIPTFVKVHQAITSGEILEELAKKTNDQFLIDWVTMFNKMSGSERTQRTSGLTSQLSHFAFGSTAKLFNQERPSITIDKALVKDYIVYFQLPALLSPFLGKATGKLVLQCLQAAVANRHRQKNGEKNFYSVFLDDFSEYLYPGFVTVLNKSRSANIGIVFAHQALGDIESMGESVANAILTNSNIKVFMRGNDPKSAEYFSKVIGTTTTTKFTERQKLGFFHTEKSGDVSAREVEEFIVHPNHFKKTLGIGEAVMIVPHERGAKTVKIKFQKLDDLKAEEFPSVSHPEILRLKQPVKSSASSNETNKPNMSFDEHLKN